MTLPWPEQPAAIQTPSRPGTGPTSGSRSGVVPKSPAHRRRLVQEHGHPALSESERASAAGDAAPDDDRVGMFPGFRTSLS
jgi:hypothetical protein